MNFKRHQLRLVLAAIATACLAGFQIYGLLICNLLRHVMVQWLASVYEQRTGKELTETGVNILWGVIVSSVFLGALFGAASVSFIAESFGRKNGLIFCGMWTVIGGILSGFSKAAGSYELLILGRLFIGFNLGSGRSLASLHLTEISPLRHRGILGVAVSVGIGMSDILGISLGRQDVFGTADGWPLALLFQSAVSIFAVAIVMCGKESPRYLFLTLGDTEGAREALEFYQGQLTAQHSLDELESEKLHYERHHVEVTWKDFLFSRSWMAQNFLEIVLQTAVNLSGIQAVGGYSTLVLYRLGMTWTAAGQYSLVMAFCTFVVSFVTVAVDRVGRRKMLIGPLVISIASVACIAVVSLGMEYFGASGNLARLAGAGITSYYVNQPILVAIILLITTELYEQAVRSKGMAIGALVYYGESFIVTLLFPVVVTEAGVAYSVLPFVVITSICLAIVFFGLPETSQRNAESIHVHWRRNNERTGLLYVCTGANFQTVSHVTSRN